ncbi:MAG: hypothetical protein QGG50_05745, partial [Methanopyri archaeon]|nr:hypothetical protein [Methanopyri archaeon]
MNQLRIHMGNWLDDDMQGFIDHFDNMALFVPEPGPGGEHRLFIAPKWAVLDVVTRKDCGTFPFKDLVKEAKETGGGVIPSPDYGHDLPEGFEPTPLPPRGDTLIERDNLTKTAKVCGIRFDVMPGDDGRTLDIKVVRPDGKKESLTYVLVRDDSGGSPRLFVEVFDSKSMQLVRHFGDVALFIPEPDRWEEGRPLPALEESELVAVKRKDCEPFELSAIMGPEGGLEGRPVAAGSFNDFDVVDPLVVLAHPVRGLQLYTTDLLNGRPVIALDRDAWYEVCGHRVRYADLTDDGMTAVVEVDTAIGTRKILFKADSFKEVDEPLKPDVDWNVTPTKSLEQRLDEGQLLTDEVRVGSIGLAALEEGFREGARLVVVVTPDERCAEELKKQFGTSPTPGKVVPSRMICCQPEAPNPGPACMVPSRGQCPSGFKALKDEWIDPENEMNCVGWKGLNRPFCDVTPSAPTEKEGARRITVNCDAFCRKVTEPKMCSFACKSCPDCTEKDPPWPCLAECVRADIGIGMAELCGKRCSRSKEPELCKTVCQTCPRCIFAKDANRCLRTCTKGRLKTFADRCDKLCAPFGKKDICGPICRDCRKCVVEEDEGCVRECVRERRNRLKEACEDTCTGRGPTCERECTRCRKCVPKLGEDGLQPCLETCIDTFGLKKRMHDMLKKVQAEDEDTTRKLLVAGALDEAKKERFQKAMTGTRRGINRKRLDDAKRSLEELEKQLTELREMEMKVKVLEKRVARVRKRVERKDLKQHVSKLVKNRAVEEGEEVTSDTVEVIANGTEVVEEDELNITLEAEVLEVSEGETIENVSVFT